MRRYVLSAAVVAALAVTGLSWPAAGAGYPLPATMAAAGDSISRGFDATSSGCTLTDCPQYSWSTATSTSVNSHYRRLLVTDPALSGHGYNDAKTGAKMADLDGQLLAAAGQGADYATVLMGANDVCTSSISTMTPTATVQAQFQKALSDFFAQRPNALVFVSSIPNVYQLWSLEHTNFWARFYWSTFGICKSMTVRAAGVQGPQKLADHVSPASVFWPLTDGWK